jgi:hypothetical protein
VIGFEPTGGRSIRFLTLFSMCHSLAFGCPNVQDDDPADKAGRITDTRNDFGYVEALVRVLESDRYHRASHGQGGC